uniref:3-deoxy-manno-octulosonate cytidylyltransferase n=1 Tax=Chlorobium chlorochromatii (strain CaD3) TaxID=340177 RepID=KDSB_CHLCH|nr:RecName: Full=3-deoxy-manno-octulosonate cytidylyltransferase; AltName: Full=CMP-2-keto-3-deoxyoctulosonic acid synthase; Short=CKS; Short=CMP-KDO synthase [Chlorobium chlorochromatii CaD3]
MNAIIIIPARLGSTRLPEKMLADIEGEPLIVRTWRQAMQCCRASRVVVATDSVKIAEVLTTYGAEVVMTSPEARCGSERIAEAARQFACDVVVNLQGDEPLISHETIDLALEPFFSPNPPDCSTLVFPLQPDDWAQLHDPNQVKVVLNREGYALYFSRSPIPFQRNQLTSTQCYRHVGLYAFKAEVLQCFAALPPTMLEEAESLEQLRLLEHGYRIRCMVTHDDQPGVNTAEDLELVRTLFKQRHQEA